VARRAVAVDGKAPRGSDRRGAAPVHLLAVMDHTTRAVLGQTDVDTTSNEITQFRPLLDRLESSRRRGHVDAMHPT
jgi:hypothetical protein